MAIHEKPNPMDQLLHQTLAYTMLLTAVFVWMEAVWPHSFTVTLGRVGGMFSQVSKGLCSHNMMTTGCGYLDTSVTSLLISTAGHLLAIILHISGALRCG